MSRPLPARVEVARAGRIRHVRVLTLYRRPVFADPAAAAAVGAVHRLRWPWREAGVLGWVLLPDQWQAVLEVDDTPSLVALVGRFKAASSRVVDPAHRINGWLWGRGFRDQPAAGGDDPAAALAALHAEPVRAGLAATPDTWPWRG